jgi:hypothetical protein
VSDESANYVIASHYNEIERLRAENAELKATLEGLLSIERLRAEKAECVALATRHALEIMRLRASNAELLTALEPFAKAAEHAENDEPSTNSLFSSSARHTIKLEDLFKARAIIARAAKGEHDVV